MYTGPAALCSAPVEHIRLAHEFAETPRTMPIFPPFRIVSSAYAGAQRSARIPGRWSAPLKAIRRRWGSRKGREKDITLGAGMAPGNEQTLDEQLVMDPGGRSGSTGDLVREGQLVRLRSHIPANRAAFQRWYADEEIARLLRHDQEPLNEIQSRGYFDTIILPLSARGLCYAVHEASTDRLIGTTALTDISPARTSALFRIVIGEKDCWGRGYGTEATRLVVAEAFEHHGLRQVRLEVFKHNPRAIAAYQRVGFRQTGEHVELVGSPRTELHVIEMVLDQEEDAHQPEGANPESVENRHAG